MSTQAVSADKLESTRKSGARIHGEVLRRLADVTQERAADCMGVDASTLSRFKDGMDRFCHLLAALGMQVAPGDSVVVSRDDLQALKRMAFKYLQAEIEAEERA